MEQTTMWGVHMPRELGDAPLQQGFIALGWREMGDLSRLPGDREAYKLAYRRAYPNDLPGRVPVGAGTVYKFVCEMKVRDLVVYPSKADRMVNIGRVKSDYQYFNGIEYPQRRDVEWLKHIPRADLPQSALNEIGSAVTLFCVSNHVDTFLSALEGQIANDVEIDDEQAERVSEQVEETTQDFILRRLKSGQNSYQFEHFVAHLLKCMGYFTRVTKASGDGGIDVIAHRDELGFEPPIIKVQCKQVLTPIGRPDVQKLFGAIERDEKGLFVTLGSFSNDARNFEQSKSNLRLIDGQTLIDLIFSYYDKFEPRYQTLLPLRRSYAPGTVGGQQE